MSLALAPCLCGLAVLTGTAQAMLIGSGCGFPPRYGGWASLCFCVRLFFSWKSHFQAFSAVVFHLPRLFSFRGRKVLCPVRLFLQQELFVQDCWVSNMDMRFDEGSGTFQDAQGTTVRVMDFGGVVSPFLCCCARCVLCTCQSTVCSLKSLCFCNSVMFFLVYFFSTVLRADLLWAPKICGEKTLGE